MFVCRLFNVRSSLRSNNSLLWIANWVRVKCINMWCDTVKAQSWLSLFLNLSDSHTSFVLEKNFTEFFLLSHLHSTWLIDVYRNFNRTDVTFCSTYRIYYEVTFVSWTVGRASGNIFKENGICIKEMWIRQCNGKTIITIGDVTKSLSHAFSWGKQNWN